MVRSRRPELEKDNPIAPQPYIGPRRRLALSRTALSTPTTVPGGVETTLQILMEAAEQFVNSVPYMQKTDRERSALLDAIAQAQEFLSVEHRPAKGSRRGSKKR